MKTGKVITRTNIISLDRTVGGSIVKTKDFSKAEAKSVAKVIFPDNADLTRLSE